MKVFKEIRDMYRLARGYWLDCNAYRQDSGILCAIWGSSIFLFVILYTMPGGNRFFGERLAFSLTMMLAGLGMVLCFVSLAAKNVDAQGEEINRSGKSLVHWWRRTVSGVSWKFFDRTKDVLFYVWIVALGFYLWHRVGISLDVEGYGTIELGRAAKK